LSEEKPNAPNGDKKVQNAKQAKPDKAKSPKKKKEDSKPSQRYVITKDCGNDDARIAHESVLSDALLEYAEENDMKPEEIEVYELGKRVKVKQEVKVLPWKAR
jgi:hypothetical protein